VFIDERGLQRNTVISEWGYCWACESYDKNNVGFLLTFLLPELFQAPIDHEVFYEPFTTIKQEGYYYDINSVHSI